MTPSPPSLGDCTIRDPMNPSARDRWIEGLRALFARGPRTYLKPGSEAVRFVRVKFRENEDQWNVARNLADALVFLESQFRLLSSAGLARQDSDGNCVISDYLTERMFDVWADDSQPKAFARVALMIVEEYYDDRVVSARQRMLNVTQSLARGRSEHFQEARPAAIG